MQGKLQANFPKGADTKICMVVEKGDDDSPLKTPANLVRAKTSTMIE